MFKIFYRKFCLGLLAIAVIIPLDSIAYTQSKGHLAEVWVIDVTVDKTEAFEEVLKSYIKQRQLAGDNLPWDIYKSQAAGGSDSYLIRHCCFKGAQRASFEDWLNHNDLLHNWAENELKIASRFDYYFFPTNGDHLTMPNTEQTQQFAAVSQFFLNQTAESSLSGHDISRKSEQAIMGDHWAWNRDDRVKSLLNIDFSFEQQVENSEDELAADWYREKEIAAANFVQNWVYEPEVYATRYSIYYFVPELSGR